MVIYSSYLPSPISLLRMVALILLINCPLCHAKTNIRILVVGDSLSAEYGLARNTGWVKKLESTLLQQHYAITIDNASISGDTTSGGKSRLPTLLEQYRPHIVILELGANDALRGLDLSLTSQNLEAMVDMAYGIKAKVILIGMRIPPNYGKQYSERFFTLYREIAQNKKTYYVPFLLQNIMDKPDWFQIDNIHPREIAQDTMMMNVYPELIKLLAK